MKVSPDCHSKAIKPYQWGPSPRRAPCTGSRVNLGTLAHAHTDSWRALRPLHRDLSVQGSSGHRGLPWRAVSAECLVLLLGSAVSREPFEKWASLAWTPVGCQLPLATAAVSDPREVLSVASPVCDLSAGHGGGHGPATGAAGLPGETGTIRAECARATSQTRGNLGTDARSRWPIFFWLLCLVFLLSSPSVSAGV